MKFVLGNSCGTCLFWVSSGSKGPWGLALGFYVCGFTAVLLSPVRPPWAGLARVSLCSSPGKGSPLWASRCSVPVAPVMHISLPSPFPQFPSL